MSKKLKTNTNLTLLVLSWLLMWCAQAIAQATLSPNDNIYAAIDALPPQGGEVKLGCGTFALDEPIFLNNNTILSGSGQCTILQATSNMYQVIRGRTALNSRQYNIRIEDLYIDGGGATFGIDFRNISNGRIRDVQIRNVASGINLYQTAYYNLIEDCAIFARQTGVQIFDGANENEIRGGKIDGKKNESVAVALRNATNTHINGPSIENFGIGVSIGDNSWGTKLRSSRIENGGIGILIKSNNRGILIDGIYWVSTTETPWIVEIDNISYDTDDNDESQIRNLDPNILEWIGSSHP